MQAAQQAPSSSGTSYSRGDAPIKGKACKGGSESRGLIPYSGGLLKGYDRGKGNTQLNKGKEGKGNGNRAHKGETSSGKEHAHSGKAWREQPQGKHKNNGKLTVNMSYRSGQEGDCAKDCKAAVVNSKQATVQQQVQPDPTANLANGQRKSI